MIAHSFQPVWGPGSGCAPLPQGLGSMTTASEPASSWPICGSHTPMLLQMSFNQKQASCTEFHLVRSAYILALA